MERRSGKHAFALGAVLIAYGLFVALFVGTFGYGGVQFMPWHEQLLWFSPAIALFTAGVAAWCVGCRQAVCRRLRSR